VVSLGKIDVRVKPDGASVYVDGVLKGASPILLSGVPAGSHDVRLEKAGHQTVVMSVVVGAGAPYVIDDVLPAIGGEEKKSVERGKSRDRDRDRAREPEPVKTGPEIKKTGRPGQKPNPYDD
jgi:hypothetical protein